MNLRRATIVILFSITLLACSNDKAQQTAEYEQVKMVKTQVLQPFTGYIERHITGRLQAADTTALSFEVSGVVHKVHINLGETFSKGQLLAELDNRVYQLAVNQRTSLLAEAKAAKVEAKQNLDRNLALKQQNLVSQAVVDNAQAAFDIANERVNSAQSALNIEQKNLGDTKLYAPYNGTISARLIEPSQQTTPQMPAFNIQGQANLEISAAISESLIGKVELGENVNVKIPALNNTIEYAAQLTEIGSQASVANAFPITITFINRHHELKPGMSAEIILPIKVNANDALLITGTGSTALYQIPLSAMATDEKGQYVQIVKENNGKYIVEKLHFEIAQTLPNALLAKLNLANNHVHEVVVAGTEFLHHKQAVMPLSKSPQIYNQ